MGPLNGRRLMPRLKAFGVVALLPAWASLTAQAATGQRLLAAPFHDHMVLQRDRPVRLWGRAAPNVSIGVEMGDIRLVAKADGNGNWRVDLPSRSSGPPQTLMVTSGSGVKQIVRDVVFGDVWLCSGQSNMDLPVRNAANPNRTAQESGRTDIRIMKITRTSRPDPATELETDIGWTRADADAVAGFSSVCWHMGVELQRYMRVPIGLIQASWGGTTIEDWMSADALRRAGGHDQELAQLTGYARQPETAIALLDRAFGKWSGRAEPGIKADPAWFAPGLDERKWGNIVLPDLWERSGVPSLADFNGVVWFRARFAATQSQAAQGAVLYLGKVDERDTVWINGARVGQTAEPGKLRRYALPPGTMKAGENHIAIRVIDERGSGGFRASANDFKVQFQDRTAIDLQGEWRYRIAGDWKAIASPPPVPWKAPRGLTTLFNGMIAPLAPFALRGVAWYQGESNAGANERYEKLLALWARDWRNIFGQPDLPFVVAQLPAFGPYRGASPAVAGVRETDAQMDEHGIAVPTAESSWAGLREAQRRVALRDPRMELATLIDLGVPTDIHPAHKEEAGRRLAWAARRVAYADTTAPLAPRPTDAVVKDDVVEIAFSDTGGALIALSGTSAIGFELCNERKKCSYVDGQVSGNRIKLNWTDRKPILVRYSWADTPIVNLYGSNGLPVTPFQMRLQ